MKMKKFWSRGGGARPLRPPLDPPLTMMLLIYREVSINLIQIYVFRFSYLLQKNYAYFWIDSQGNLMAIISGLVR